jgi:DNA-binding NtrC family response regulator
MIAYRLVENTVERETILYISDQATSNNSVLAALKATGCEVVGTNSSTQAIAMLFVMHSVAAVVLNQRARKQTNFDMARSLRAIRPNVPIVLLCRGQIDRSPSCVDACVSTGQPLEKLTCAVRRLLTAKRFRVQGAQF